MKSILYGPTTFSKLGVLLLSFFVLSACVTVKQHPLPPDSELNKQATWEAHRATIESLQTWVLKGRVAGRSNDEGFRAGVHWSQMQENFVIDLHGPLGRKVAVIKGIPGNVELNTSKGQHFEASDPEELMQKLFAYSLPINGLQHWLLGVPSPDQAPAELVLDEQGRLKQLRQAGWLVDYKRYHESTPALPALMQISNPNLNANIKIDRWTIEQ